MAAASIAPREAHPGRVHIGESHWSTHPREPRGGPIGDVLASVLQFAGADVHREYYVEDGGTQVKRFGESVAIRYRQLYGEETPVPAGCVSR